MRLSLVSTAIFFALVPGLHAQTTAAGSTTATAPQPEPQSKPASISPARAAKIEEMLTVTGVKTELLEANKQAQEGLKRYARRQVAILPEVPDPQKAKLQQITTDYIAKQDDYATRITWTKLRPSLVQFCADNYTDDEMNGIIAFYKSPVGIAMKKKEAALSQAEKDAVTSLQHEIVPPTLQLTKDLQDKVKELHPISPGPRQGSSAAPPGFLNPGAATTSKN